MEPMRQIDPEGPATEFVNYPEAPEDDEDDDDHYLVEDESDYHFDDEEDEVDGWERCMRPIGMIRKPKSVVRYPTLKLHDYNRSKVKSRFFSINIKCSQNNVFCVLTDFFTGKNLCSYSSGTYGIKISRKTVRYNIKTVLTYFFRQIKKQMSNAEILIFILTIPINSKKNILSFIFSQLDKTDNKVIFFVLKNLKCFNGCRLKKKKRKKHKIRRFLDV
jgi:ribosomal protein S11